MESIMNISNHPCVEDLWAGIGGHFRYVGNIYAYTRRLYEWFI